MKACRATGGYGDPLEKAGDWREREREAWQPIDMGGMDMGHGTGQAGPDKAGLNRLGWDGTFKSIIIILEADMVHVCAGVPLLRYLLTVANQVHAQVPSTSASLAHHSPFINCVFKSLHLQLLARRS